jgi:GT2 family glycosyltransferase
MTIASAVDAPSERARALFRRSAAGVVPMLQPKVSVLIPVLNDAEGLRRCVGSIRSNGYPLDRIELIVADNGSTDGSDEVARRLGAAVVRMPGVPVSTARNRLAELATGDILAFVDADHELASGWFASAVHTLQQPGIAAVGAPYHAPSDGTWVQRQYDAFRARASNLADTRWLGSGNLAVWKRRFAEIGGFDAALVTCEDVDFCQRLRRAGGRLIDDPRLHSIHHGDPRTLRQLFVSELWRGRDNLRVSLRVRPDLRELPSIVIPVVVLLALLSLPVVVLAAAFGIFWPAGVTLAVLAGAPVARTALMLRRLRDGSLRTAGRVFAVAATYDVARALALVARKGHRRAR